MCECLGCSGCTKTFSRCGRIPTCFVRCVHCRAVARFKLGGTSVEQAVWRSKQEFFMERRSFGDRGVLTGHGISVREVMHTPRGQRLTPWQFYLFFGLDALEVAMTTGYVLWTEVEDEDLRW